MGESIIISYDAVLGALIALLVLFITIIIACFVWIIQLKFKKDENILSLTKQMDIIQRNSFSKDLNYKNEIDKINNNISKLQRPYEGGKSLPREIK
jgi:hypothetical protein